MVDFFSGLEEMPLARMKILAWTWKAAWTGCPVSSPVWRTKVWGSKF